MTVLMMNYSSIVSKEKDDKGAEKLVASNLVVTVDAEEEEVVSE